LISGKKDIDEKVIEIRNKINHGINEESIILNKLVTLKHTYKWLKENEYSIPDKLKNEIDLYEKLIQSTSVELSKAIIEWDNYIK
jgi:hypothetical protein